VESPGSWVTVGEFKSGEMGVPYIPAWKAKTLRKLTQERVLLELGNRIANSIGGFFETAEFSATHSFFQRS
jgi:hypothetical protein